MSARMSHAPTHLCSTAFWCTRTGMALMVFLAAAAALLAAEHWAHLAGYLPFLLLLACPLMHLFMHGGHDHGGTKKE